MITIGIDAGKKRCGVAMHRDKTPVKQWSFPVEMNTVESAFRLANEVIDICEQVRPEDGKEVVVIVEIPKGFGNPETKQTLAGCVYAVASAINQYLTSWYDVRVEEVSPSQWRSRLALPRVSDSKKQSMLYASAFGYTGKIEDEADAFCISLSHCDPQKQPISRPKKRKTKVMAPL